MISHNEIEELEKRTLCVDCIGEQFLKARIDDQGKVGVCHYCGKRRKITAIGEIADEIHEAFERHYQRTDDKPSAFEYSMIKEFGDLWERKGEPVVYALAEAAGIDENVAEDIRKVLEYHHGDRTAAKVGEEGSYDEGAHYDDRELDDFEYQESWTYFEKNLKTESRFFSEAAKDTLDHIFEELAEYNNLDEKSVIVEAGPGTEMTTLYRARVFQNIDQLKEALKHPEVNLGPPPATLAIAGRMNPHGVSVFYGATESKIAISEVRPPVGSRVVVGSFELLRKVRLLDVSALRSVYVKGSIFDTNYIYRLERAKFLERLSKRISRPVMPNDEPLEYLVTQAIADYLAGHSEPAIDGIIFPSVQGRFSGVNVVLFHKASRVKLVVLPPRTKINVSFASRTDDDWEFDYWVEEEMPSDTDQEAVNSFLSMVGENDLRESTLCLDSKNLVVHHVKSLVYETESQPVRRHRWKKQEHMEF